VSTERTEGSEPEASPFEEKARAHAREERAEQGLGPTLTDPLLIERLAVMLRAHGRPSNEPRQD
jgi:hypothetical protein